MPKPNSTFGAKERLPAELVLWSTDHLVVVEARRNKIGVAVAVQVSDFHRHRRIAHSEIGLRFEAEGAGCARIPQNRHHIVSKVLSDQIELAVAIQIAKSKMRGRISEREDDSSFERELSRATRISKDGYVVRVVRDGQVELTIPIQVTDRRPWGI